MKSGPIIPVLLLLAGPGHAELFRVGGQELEIPSPESYSRIMQEMDTVYRLSLRTKDPLNDQLAYYIAESEVPAALAGEIPSLERFYILKVN